MILIPPRTELKLYYGLIWLRGFQVTKKTYESVMDVIGLFLKNKGDSIKNTYYAVKKNEGSYEIIQRYPKSPPILVKPEL